MSRNTSHTSSIARIVASRVSGGGDGLWRSPSAWIAVAGMALALTVMLLAMMIVVGFKQEIRSKIASLDPAITVSNYNDQSISYIDETDAQGRRVMGVDSALLARVKAAMPPDAIVTMSTRREAVLRTDSAFAGVSISGYSPTFDYTFLAPFITAGKIPDWSDPDTREQIVISSTIARDLTLDVGDRIDAFFFTGGNLRQRKLTVAAIFNANFPERDRLQCYGSIDLLNRMAQYPDGNSQSIEVRGISLDSITPLKDHLLADLNQYQLQLQATSANAAGPWVINDIFENAGQWLNWLDMLDTNVVVILTLMGAVGAFTLLSSLFILVLERIRMIGTLKALGATNRQITHIFILISCRIVALGLVLGNVIALSAGWVQQHYHLISLNPEAYFIDYVPVTFIWWQLALVNLGVIILALCIMLIPSRMIARLSPTAAIKFD